MQFKVESTGVTHRFSIGIASPQCCCACVTVCTQCACPLADNLKHRQEIIRVSFPYNEMNCCLMTYLKKKEGKYFLSFRHQKKYHISVSYQSLLGPDQRSVLAIHLVVQSTRVAQVVACTIPAPQRGSCGPTVHTLSGLCSKSKSKHFLLHVLV